MHDRGSGAGGVGRILVEVRISVGFGDGDARQGKGRAWLYISAVSPACKLMMRVACGAVAPNMHIKLGAQDLGCHGVESGDLHVVEIELPREQAPAKVIEVELYCDIFRPSKIAESGDRRELGVRVAEVWPEWRGHMLRDPSSDQAAWQ